MPTENHAKVRVILKAKKARVGISQKKLIALDKRKTILVERSATSSPCLKAGVPVAQI